MPCGIELRSLEQSRAESAECGFSSVAKKNHSDGRPSE